jgi:hypothetical protein
MYRCGCCGWIVPVTQDFQPQITGTVIIPGYPSTSLPPASPSGQLVRINDSFQGIAVSDGTKFSRIDTPLWRPERFAPPGAPLDVALQAVQAAMPFYGGTIDARGYTGNQAMTTTVTITKPCKILFDEIYLTSSANPMFSFFQVPGAVVFEGLSRDATFLRSTAPSQVLIMVQSLPPVTIKQMTLDHVPTGGSRTGGAAIQVLGSAGQSNGFSEFSDLRVEDQWVGLDLINASSFTVRNCYILNSWSKGMHISNTVAPDNGNNSITECTFDTTHNTLNVTAIYQASSGGLRLINNKILNHYYGYALDVAGDTAILLIQGNSFEFQTACIDLRRSAGGATFGAIVINGNLCGTQIGNCIQCSSSAISHLIVSENTLNIASPHSAISLPAITYASIHDNIIIGNGGSSTGVFVDTNASFVDVGPNFYANVGTPVGNLNTTTPYTSIAVPSFSTTQRDALAHPNGMHEIIYNTSTGQFQGWSGVGWVVLG